MFSMCAAGMLECMGSLTIGEWYLARAQLTTHIFRWHVCR